MTASRKTGPRVVPSLSTGPRIATAQPGTPPTNVHLGNDRLLMGAREIDISQLFPDPDQPRKYMHPDRLAELARSIDTHGILQPLVVRQDGLGRDGDMRYTIVAGGRRYAAVRLAIQSATSDDARRRLARVPVVLSESPAAERRVLQLIENLQREDLNPVEEARALKEIMRLEKLSTDGVAARVHRSQGYVDERLRLLRHEDVEEAVETGLLTKSAAAAIASVRDAEARQDWLARARLGEVIRPRDVYASKPNRRRSTATPALPNFGNEADTAPMLPLPPAASGSSASDHPSINTMPVTSATASAIVPSTPSAALVAHPAAGTTNTSHLRGTTSPTATGARHGDSAVYAGGWAQALRVLSELGVPLPPNAETFVGASPVTVRALLAALIAGLADEDRRAVEQLLAAGTLLGMSCEELLRAVKV
jgi:ParB/RepB/Spo0J family partition protein